MRKGKGSRLDKPDKLQDKIARDGKAHLFSERFKARRVSKSPYIVKINNFLDKKEKEELLALTKGKFERSNIVVNGELVYDDNQRTSSTAYIFKDGLPDKYSKTIERLIERICYLADCERGQIEMMAVRYKKGEFFGPHVDYFDEDEIGVLDSAGQRIMTFFVYLNTLEKGEGGETEFTKLGIKSQPKKGDAVFWYNQDPKTGKMLPETEHQGNPVLSDTVKFGLNIWVRSSTFY